VCQYPAIKNQKYLCNTDFFNVIRVITKLTEMSLSKETKKDIFTLQRKIVLLLRGLLEERNDKIVETLSNKLEREDLKEIIEFSLVLAGIHKMADLNEYLNTKEDRLIEELENVVDALIVIKVLNFSIEDIFSDQN
jgi:hypothetical protein